MEPSVPGSSDATRTAASGSHPTLAFGSYRLLQKIGEGGMGEVWLAEQTRPVRRQVALKIIKAGMDTAQVVARFEAERQALALMDHPAIATVFDGGSTPEGRPYFAMEYVKGEPITAYCDRQRLGTKERLGLFILVCEGVQHAHQKGIIHRDLKPSNVLVTLQDDHPVPKIIDFGVAKATTQHLTERSLFTELGVLIGTPEYMSPEQAELTGLDIDTRTDVYALGALLYELLTGALPFERKLLREKGLDEIRRTIREVEPPRPSTRITQQGPASTEAATNRHTEPSRLASQLRGDLDWITMKALEKDRTRRYDTVTGLANDVRRHLHNEPVVAGPPSAAYRARKFVRRHRLGVTAAALVAVSLVLGIGGATVGLVRARRAEQAARDAAAKAEAINAFLLDTLGAANPAEGQSRAVTVLDALRSAERTVGSAFTSQPEIEAAVRTSIGITYERLGFYTDAERLLRSALQIGARTTQFKPLTRLAAEVALGVVLHDQGELADAESVYRQALATALGLSDAQAAASVKSNLALLLFDKGDYAAAEPLTREVLASDRQLLTPEDPSLATSLNNLGRVLRALERRDEALALYREADIILAKTDHPFRAITLGNIGELECERRNVDVALSTLTQGLALGSKLLGEQQSDVVTVRAKLGRCLAMARRFDEAEHELLTVARSWEGSAGGYPARLEQVARDLADMYDAWGKPDKAAEWRAKLPKQTGTVK